jgi:flagellar basal body P-ring protein FlgI
MKINKKVETAAQKRVNIAKDVLLRLKKGLIKPESGAWIDFANNIDEVDIKANTDAKTILDKKNVMHVE